MSKEKTRAAERPKRRPEWIRLRPPGGETYQEIRRLMRSKALHTVCEEARCPNMGECWGKNGTATFLILGDVCTRSCRFCDVTTGKPGPLDWDEPERVAQAVKAMNLRHVVVTSVNRDELPDGGAAIFAETIRQVHTHAPGCTGEVLIPDFKGDRQALAMVMDAQRLQSSSLPPPAKFSGDPLVQAQSSRPCGRRQKVVPSFKMKICPS